MSIFLAMLIQVAAGDISIDQAESLARRDEASLRGDLSAQFFEKQGKALGMALHVCGVTDVHQVARLKIVMKLDGQGRVIRTWLNRQDELGKCVEAKMAADTFLTDGRPEFYTFIYQNYDP